MTTLPTTYTPVTPPYAHQRRALEAGWQREGYGYLMEMGLGKSRVVIDNFCLLYTEGLTSALLVVAPKGVYTNWSRHDDSNPGELQRWLWPNVALNQRRFVYQAGKTKLLPPEMTANSGPPGPRIMLINSEAVAAALGAAALCDKFLAAHPSAMVVVDESTLMKNPKSQRTKALLRIRGRARWRRILSGLPTTGSPSDLWAQFEFLTPGALGARTYNLFRYEYTTMRQIIANGRTINVETGVRNVPQLAARVQQHSFRARKAECLDLPEKVYVRREVELTADQRRLYKELKTTAMLELAGDGLTTQNVVTQLLRLHQLVCGCLRSDSGGVIPVEENRTAALLDVLTNEDVPAIIWCTYQEDVRRIRRALVADHGEGCVSEWHGGVTQRERETGEARWQAGEARWMLATPQAGGRGRTWVRAQLAVYYSNTYDLELRQQSEDRTHRIGQLGTCTYVDLVSSGTVDEAILAALLRKEDVVRFILQDGPRAMRM